MILSFSNDTTERIFLRQSLSKKVMRSLGSLNLGKAGERLALLDRADEKVLLTTPALHYHKLHGTDRYSIDADSRKSKWRITFSWQNNKCTDVCLVLIEDTH